MREGTGLENLLLDGLALLLGAVGTLLGLRAERRARREESRTTRADQTKMTVAKSRADSAIKALLLFARDVSLPAASEFQISDLEGSRKDFERMAALARDAVAQVALAYPEFARFVQRIESDAQGLASAFSSKSTDSSVYDAEHQRFRRVSEIVGVTGQLNALADHWSRLIPLSQRGVSMSFGAFASFWAMHQDYSAEQSRCLEASNRRVQDLLSAPDGTERSVSEPSRERAV